VADGQARALLLGRLGRLPEPPAPAPPKVDRRFVVEGVAFERWLVAGPEETIPCYFMIPEAASGPRPALLALHPHGHQYETGKSLVAGLVGDGTRAYGLAAAKAGFAVLAPDMHAFEARRPPRRARSASYALRGEGYERLLAMQALVTGTTLQARILTDLQACISTLALDARADISKLAAIGQSFGGQETIFLMLLDDRVKAGVASCGFSMVKMLVERSISHNMALYLPGLLPGLDFDAIVPALAPRPLTIVAGLRDAIYPVEGVRHVVERASAAYEAAGAKEALRVRYFEGPHDFPLEEQASSIAWLAKVAAGEAG